MTIAPIANLTPHHQAADADDGAARAAQLEVAQQFEAIFLRQLMGSLEKAGGFGGSSDGGNAIFGSMMVSALADNAAASGGIGLADIIFKAMMPPAAPGAPPAADAAAASAVTGVAAGKTPPAAGTAATPQPLPVLPGGS